VPYCTNCGTQERDDQRFCIVCGAATPGASAPVPMPAMPSLATSEGTGEAQVRVGFSMDPPRQSRWSIFFRLLLSLPLLVVTFGIAIAAAFVTIAAWFCALFTGRVPDDIQRFLTNALRLYANVAFYACFLTSRWPGISFNPKPSDQVTIDIDHVSLSRWAVFFRYPLAFPAAIVGLFSIYGSYPVLVVMWFWGTIMGREPRPLHQALSLVLRYQIRYQAYAAMISPTQPFKGLLGDGSDSATLAGLNANVGAQSAPAPVPLSVDTVAPPTATAPSMALSNRWLVRKGAKAVVIIILVIGIPSYIFPLAFGSTLFNGIPFVNSWKTLVARVIVSGTEQNVADTMNQFEVTAEGCDATSSIPCVTNAAAQAYSQLMKQTAIFQNNVFFPSSSLNQAVRYEATLDVLEANLLKIETSNSYQSDQQIVYNVLPRALRASNVAYEALVAQLRK
jgi:hypothetical protein